MWQEYETPTSVKEALAILERHRGQARIIAGGTDLIIQLQQCKCAADCLVDVTHIPGLDRIEQNGSRIQIGANVTFRQIKESNLLREHARVLAEAAATVGALPIQTVATLAGNVVNAMPAADGSVALVALEAEAEIADMAGRSWRPISELFRGPGLSAVDPTRQMLTAIRFPSAGPRQGSAWERVGRRQALVLPILNCAVIVSMDTTRARLEWARIGLGPVAPVPYRARQAEAFLTGSPLDPEVLARAAEIAASESHPRGNLLRASQEYRLDVLKVLVRHGLERAVAQALERAA